MQLEIIIPNVIQLTERLIMSGKLDMYYFRELAISIISNGCIKSEDDCITLMDVILIRRMEILN